MSAIPCLAYRRALEEEVKQKEIDREIEEHIRNGTWKQYHPQTQTDNNKKTDISSENQVIQCPFKRGVNNENAPKKSSVNNKSNDQDISEIKKTNSKQNKMRISDDVYILTGDETNNDIGMLGTNLVETLKTKENQSDTQISDDVYILSDDESNVNVVNVDQPMENGDCSRNIGETNENNEEGSRSNVEATKSKAAEEVPLNRQPVVLPGGIVMPPPRVETVSTSWKTQHLTHDQVNDYCKKLFQFKTVNIMHFRYVDFTHV